MCGCSGTSVSMSSKFMFNVNNARLNNATLNTFRVANRSFRISAPRKVFQNQKVRKSSFSNKTGGLKRFYFSY